MDEVSVYSLLASRVGPIASEFTDTETASLNSAVEGSLGGGFGLTKADLRSKVDTTSSQSTQILRKSIVQTTFKELYELERDSLVMSPSQLHQPPLVQSIDDLTPGLSWSHEPGWVVDASRLGRGQLIEVEIELGTDSVFRVSAVISTLIEILQENLQLFGGDHVAGLAEMRSVGRVLESLLAGLVPIKCRLPDYQVASLGDEVVLVHKDVADQLDDTTGLDLRPAYLVGVTERALFWKDIRRVLFSGAKYRALCRMSAPGIARDWRPVKLVEVLNEVHPSLGLQVENLGDLALQAMGDAVAKSDNQSEESESRSVALAYVNLLLSHHGKELDPSMIDQAVAAAVPGTPWLTDIDSRRSVFRTLTDRVDAFAETNTSPAVAAQLRTTAVLDAGIAPLNLAGAGLNAPTVARDRDHDRFLDCEIIAIYW